MSDLIALVPMGSVALLFVFVMRAVMGADRRERAALAALDAREAVDPTTSRSSATTPDDLVVGDVLSRRDVASQGGPSALSERSTRNTAEHPER